MYNASFIFSICFIFTFNYLISSLCYSGVKSYDYIGLSNVKLRSELIESLLDGVLNPP